MSAFDGPLLGGPLEAPPVMSIDNKDITSMHREAESHWLVTRIALCVTGSGSSAHALVTCRLSMRGPSRLSFLLM